MTKILFVCLGNICRSPMAEFMFKDMIKKAGEEDLYYIESAGTSNEEDGNPIHYGAREKLAEVGIFPSGKSARQIRKDDYSKFDYIIVMEDRNIRNVKRIVGEDINQKIYRLLDFSNKPRDIADPWYTGNFNETYLDLKEGLECFYKYLKKEAVK